ncbi:MAG: R2-like ligand-binding oxidase [Caldilineaceae bacterium]|nr:R2-like ligand-binding oxidase [Caldilineaceae bacterium]
MIDRHNNFTTVRRGLERASVPMKLYEKAKRYGIWNPTTIDFSQDRMDWATLTGDEQEILLRLTTMFQAGEEAVTLDLLPLIGVIAAEGRLEEEIFLTSFLADEAKHTDFFTRFLEEVTGETRERSHFHLENYREIFYRSLPSALGRLYSDPSPAAQVRAAVTYNLIVEGVLAETGYHAYLTVLQQRGILPGQQMGIVHLKTDESRHIAYGLYLICRLIAEDGSLYAVAEETLNELLVPALGVIEETFACYDPQRIPFGLTPASFTDYALAQFQSRLGRLEVAQRMSGFPIGEQEKWLDWVD